MPDTKRFPSGSGGRQRAKVIDDNVSAMASRVGGRRAPSPGSAVRSTGRQSPAKPSSFAPSGTAPTEFTFGTPMQEGGKPRGQEFADAHAEELRNQVTQSQREVLTK